MAVVGQPPSFTRITKCSQTSERDPVIDNPNARSPGQLDQLVPSDGDSLTEVLPIEADFLHDFAGFQANLAHHGMPFHPGTFVEKPIVEDQPLREGRSIVRISMD